MIRTTVGTTIDPKWDRRIRRADELASTYPFSAEGLRYYSRIATFQKNLYTEIQKALAGTPKISADRPLRDELDLFLLLPHFSGFLNVIQQIAPSALAEAAAGLARKGSRVTERGRAGSGKRSATMHARPARSLSTC